MCLEYDIMVNKARSSCKGTIRSVTACIVAFNPVLGSNCVEKLIALLLPVLSEGKGIIAAQP